MISAEIQKLETSAFIYLYTLDLSGIAPELPAEQQLLRFCPMTNELGNPVVWQGHAYTPYPVHAEGFSISSQGVPPRPLLRAANINGVLTALCQAHQDLAQAKLTRIKTFARFLDAVNFAAGNPEADPFQHYPIDVFRVERKTEENDVYIEWELRWPFDLQGVLLPGRFIAQNTCPSVYKSPECGWVPVEGKYFGIRDYATGVAGDECSKRLKGCELRWGTKAVLPYGGFPGAGMVRR